MVRAGFGMFFDAFSQDMVLGHLPYPTVLCSRTGVQPDWTGADSFGRHLNGSIWLPDTPVYAAPSLRAFECDIFAFDRNIKTPYMENYNLNIQQQIDEQGGAAGRLCGIAGASAVALLRHQPAQRGARSTAADLGCDCIHDFGSAARPFGGHGRQPVRCVLRDAGELHRQVELQLAAGQLAHQRSGTASLRS